MVPTPTLTEGEAAALPMLTVALWCRSAHHHCLASSGHKILPAFTMSHTRFYPTALLSSSAVVLTLEMKKQAWRGQSVGSMRLCYSLSEG